jgi:hypothetical protein
MVMFGLIFYSNRISKTIMKTMNPMSGKRKEEGCYSFILVVVVSVVVSCLMAGGFNVSVYV